jgi:hypothetical protein
LINRQEDFNGLAPSRLNRFILDRIFNGFIFRDLHGALALRCSGPLGQLRRIGAAARPGKQT